MRRHSRLFQTCTSTSSIHWPMSAISASQLFQLSLIPDNFSKLSFNRWPSYKCKSMITAMTSTENRARNIFSGKFSVETYMFIFARTASHCRGILQTAVHGIINIKFSVGRSCVAGARTFVLQEHGRLCCSSTDVWYKTYTRKGTMQK